MLLLLRKYRLVYLKSAHFEWYLFWHFLLNIKDVMLMQYLSLI